jgi:DNA gyrase subunit A
MDFDPNMFLYYIKRINPTTYKIQKRGGKGMLGMKTMGDDIVEHFLSASTHDNLLFFTDSGKVFQTQLYEIPEGTRVARGRGLLNFLEISTEEKVLEMLPLTKEETGRVKYLMMVTKNGKIKKTSLEDFKNVRRSGIIAIKLQKGDFLKKVVKTTGEDEIILATKRGIAIRFKEKNIRPMGRASAGVRGINLKKGDEVIGMELIQKTENNKQQTEKKYLLVVMDKGYGKRTALNQYRVQGRGGSGIKTAQITAKTGELIFTKVLSGSPAQILQGKTWEGEEEDLIVVSQKGQVIRTKINSISILGRATQGVRIMRLDEGDKVASGACI